MMFSSYTRIRDISGLIMLIIFLTLMLNACNLPARKSSIQTEAAQTVTAELAKLTETEAIYTLIPTYTATLLPTLVPFTGTATSTTIPTTPAPSEPSIIGLEDTNCRMGPNPNYPRLGFILKGQTSIVRGRNSTNTWWYIDNPSNPSQQCWVWGQTTQVSGDVAQLPVITPPPPPAEQVNFTALLVDVHNCFGIPTAIFQVVNTGNLTLKSMLLTIRDLTIGATVFGPDGENSPFMPNPGGCPPGGNHLPSGQTGYIGGEVGWLVTTGDSGRAIIQLCSEPGLGGECLEATIQFIFP